MALENIISWLSSRSPRNISLNTFSGRFRIQKGVFLLQVLGYPAVRKYPYSIYLKGPYCRDLADDYYSSRPISDFSPARDIPASYNAIFEELYSKNDEFIETVITLCSMSRANRGITKKELFDHFKWVKPNRIDNIGEGWEFLKKHGLVRGIT